jgi:hypothetical protein
MNFSILYNKAEDITVLNLFDQKYNEFICNKHLKILIFSILVSAIASFVLNTFTFCIFLTERFKSNFDRYLKIYTFNTLIINLHIIISFLKASCRSLPISYTLSDAGFWIRMIRSSKLI